MKRLMSYVVLATFPCVLMSWYNTGYQALDQLDSHASYAISGWQGTMMQYFDWHWQTDSIWSCMTLGALFFFPVYFVTIVTGGLLEVLFAVGRKHEINEGFLVTSILYTLTMPPGIPLWVVAIGIAFGVVIGKEVFGGVGKNFLNPALTGRVFIYFAYPAYLSGDGVWVAVDGISSATVLGASSVPGTIEAWNQGYNWWQFFWGTVPGSLGETSAFACLIGGIALVYMRIASWRIMVGAVIGLVASALLLNAIGSDTNPMFAFPWYWHLVAGGFAFGTVFMATDPVSAAQTNPGRWLYGILIGFMTALIRVVNPAFPEGVMLAILFANIFAPTIDYFVARHDISRRKKYISDLSPFSPGSEQRKAAKLPRQPEGE